MAYPFSDPEPSSFDRYSSNLAISYLVDEEYALLNDRPPHTEHLDDNPTWIAIMNGVEKIRLSRSELFTFEGLIFTDCFAISYEPTAYALLHRFKTVNCIAPKAINFKERQIVDRLKASEGLPGDVCVTIGRFQDYFDADSDIVYINLTVLEALDEAVIAKSFFRCCRSLKPRSLIIIITSLVLEQWEFDFEMRLMLSFPVVCSYNEFSLGGTLIYLYEIQ